MSDFLLSQIIVAVALVFDLGSVQLRQRQQLIIGQAIAGTLIAAHFFLLELHTAGWLFTLGVVRLLVSLKWQSLTILFPFLIAMLAFTFYTYDGYLSVVSCIAGMLMAVGSFSKTMKRLRLFYIAGSTTWLVHNILAWTPVGVFMEFLFLSSNLIAYYRFIYKRP